MIWKTFITFLIRRNTLFPCLASSPFLTCNAGIPPAAHCPISVPRTPSSPFHLHPFLETHLPSLLPADSITYTLCGQGQPNTWVASPGQGHSHCPHHHQSLSHGISSAKNLRFINTHELHSNLFNHYSGNFLLMVRMWDSQLASCLLPAGPVFYYICTLPYPRTGIKTTKILPDPGAGPP